MTNDFIPIYNADTDQYYTYDGALEDYIDEYKEENDGEMPDLSKLYKCKPTKVPLIDLDFDNVFAEGIEIPNELIDLAKAYNNLAQTIETGTYCPTKTKYIYK